VSATLLRGPILWTTELGFVRRIFEESSIGRTFAGRFVAGATLDDGLRAAEGLRERGIASMLDLLGENASLPAQAAEAADAYILALKRIRESPQLDCEISVKLTQLGLDSSTDVCAQNMDRVLSTAVEGTRPLLVMIDMESREYVDRTLDIYLELRDRHPNVGVCLQACLFRTADDAARIAGPAAIVRMTKGAYLEPREAAFHRRSDVGRSYVRTARMLLERGSTVHFATHDERLIEGAREYVHRRSSPADRYEFQMLYGVRRNLQSRLVAEGEPVRVYVPYGTQWYPYLTRRLAERPANVWFFLSNAVRWRG
jgi:proline dehydrogenase